jgi:hypothetical protein
MIGLWDINALLQYILDNNVGSGFNFYLFDARLPKSNSVIFPLISEYRSIEEIPKLWEVVERAIPDTNWTLVAIPTEAFISGKDDTAIATVVVVCTATILSIILLLHQIFHRETKRRMHSEKQALLKTILPEQISSQLMEKQNSEVENTQEGEVIAETRDNACVMFMDIAGFTDFSSRVSAVTVVSMLNRLFSKIDELCVKHHIEKIKTIGDCYMAANGIFSNAHDIL